MVNVGSKPPMTATGLYIFTYQNDDHKGDGAPVGLVCGVHSPTSVEEMSGCYNKSYAIGIMIYLVFKVLYLM